MSTATGAEPGLALEVDPEDSVVPGAPPEGAVAHAGEETPVEPVAHGVHPRPSFTVDLDVFSGPFDVLLGLIAKHKLDVTEVALAQVTDDFIRHIRDNEDGWDLEQASHFLVVAATLLDLKAARLLPQAEVEDEGDLALLEARDLLFARLLQYRAYKEVAGIFAARMAEESRMHPRAVGLEPRFAALVPEVLLGLGPTEFAALAAAAMAPKEVPSVSVAHLHAPRVSVREQAAAMVERLRLARTATFRSLIADAGDTTTVVARFLALLELFREGAVAFEQLDAFGELHVRWTGAETGGVDVHDEFDEDAELDAELDAEAAADPAAAEDAEESATPESEPDATEESDDDD